MVLSDPPEKLTGGPERSVSVKGALQKNLIKTVGASLQPATVKTT